MVKENIKIKEFKVGEEVQGVFIIKTVAIRISTNNKKYLDMNIVDSTGEVNAKLWDCSDEQENLYKENILVKIRGHVSEWRGQQQLKINKIRLTTDEDELNLEEFVPVAPEKDIDMFNEVMRYVELVKNKDIKAILNEVISLNKEKLMYYPAAKSNHHAIRSGLLYHMKRMLMVAESLCSIYLNLNSDLLYAGIILHDIAKIEEMDSSELGIVSSYTMEGQLLGHIIQGIKDLEVIGNKLNADKEVVIMLQHMVLSHHYEAEYGSPKKPMFPEAELLHHIDMIDARMYDMEKALRDVEPGEFSDRIWVLNNISLYKSRFDKKGEQIID